MSAPNILLIVSDDHGYGDRSALGSCDAQTPHLDALARSGMEFTNAYVTAPICSPSRSGLIAGAYQQRWGAHWFDTSRFPPTERKVLPEMLGEAGYDCGYFGKVHYGHEQVGDRACPERHGFASSFYGLAGPSMGRLHYLTHSSDALQERGEDVQRVHGVSPMYENGTPVDTYQHLTVELADRTIDFLEADRRQGENQPFFCYTAFNAVHNFTWQLPQDELEARGLPSYSDFDPDVEEYVDWYDGAISPNLENGRAYYLAQLEIMDREIGRILDSLERSGQRENTLVVYMTDNGGSTCNYGDNAPLEGAKYSLYEGGIRVPLLVSWPSAISPGQTSDVLASSLDLVPTFLQAAGAEGPRDAHLDGRSLQQVWNGDGAGHEYLHFDTGFQWAVRNREWKLRWADPENDEYRRRILLVEHTDIGAGLSLVPIGSNVDESAAADCSAEQPEVVQELFKERSRWLDSIAGEQHDLMDREERS
ncbi:sulfatase family protein [Brachybacterium sp. AOP42-C2-15]|uniref:sulfatase family protein n=1 Tax=Brachybacterium sp. AOP42-C2-15 TaxID=3457670 RepID=UPI004034DAA7